MSDLIKREDVVEALYQAIRTTLTSTFTDSMSLAIAMANNLPSVKPERKWIPVTEALPENAEFVLLTIRRLDKSYNQIPFISVGYISWNQTAWWCAHDGDCDTHNVEVLAWMPLPEPWKGE